MCRAVSASPPFSFHLRWGRRRELLLLHDHSESGGGIPLEEGWATVLFLLLLQMHLPLWGAQAVREEEECRGRLDRGSGRQWQRVWWPMGAHAGEAGADDEGGSRQRRVSPLVRERRRRRQGGGATTGGRKNGSAVGEEGEEAASRRPHDALGHERRRRRRRAGWLPFRSFF